MGKELTEIIQETICALPANFRLVIILRELQGLSYEEIAKITKIARARSKMQEYLKPYLT